MFLAPASHLTDEDQKRGLKLLVNEAAFSAGTVALTSGAILTAFALHLGASNLWIGVLASAPFLTQLLQVPAILLIERLRARKRIAVVTSVIGRTMLLVMAFAAFWSGPAALMALLAAQYVLCGFGAVGSCAWNAWLRDLAPDDMLGRVLARRSIWTASVSLVAGLVAALILARTPDNSSTRDLAFAGMFVIGCVTGLISARIVSAIPEPQMREHGERAALLPMLRAPFSDGNFRRLLIFVVSWQFAVNLATPFFTVFIVEQLGFDVSFVLVLSAVSQLANVLALRSWGMFSDRFASKSVLLVAAPAYILAIVAMIAASQTDNPVFVTGWLVFLHVVMGTAVAGTTLASTNIALKLSPRGAATAYVASNALATATAAGLAPIIGGMLADFFARRQLELVVRWTGPDGTLALPITITHWDFYFLLSGIIGLFAIHRLSLVAEEGEIEAREMAAHVAGHAWRSVRNISTVAGLRGATELPAMLLRDARTRFRFDSFNRGRAARHDGPEP
jgi:MFS family permease